MALDRLKGKWLLLPVVVVGTLAVLMVTGVRLHAQGCGGAPSQSHHAGGSTYSDNGYSRQAPTDGRESSAAISDACPLEPASLERLARDLDLDSRQYDTVDRIQRSYVDRVSPIERRVDGDRQELARVLDTDRVDAKRARRLVSSIGKGYTDLQQARLEAYLQVQDALDPDQVRRLPFCPYLVSEVRAELPPAGGRSEEERSEPPAPAPHQHH